MDRFYKMMKRNNKGFTLVELMVVLLILGILVAIAIPIYNRTTANAEANTCKANLRTLDGAAAQFHAEHGQYPTATEVTGTTFVGENGYIKETPTCPSDGTAYTYDASTGSFTCNKSTDATYPHKYK